MSVPGWSLVAFPYKDIICFIPCVASSRRNMLVRHSFLSQNFLATLWLSVVSEHGFFFSISIHLLCFSIHPTHFLKTPGPGSPGAGGESLSTSRGFTQPGFLGIIFQWLAGLIIPPVGKVWLVDINQSNFATRVRDRLTSGEELPFANILLFPS